MVQSHIGQKASQGSDPGLMTPFFNIIIKKKEKEEGHKVLNWNAYPRASGMRCLRGTGAEKWGFGVPMQLSSLDQGETDMTLGSHHLFSLHGLCWVKGIAEKPESGS